MDFKHVSVLLDETIEGLNINPDGIYFDDAGTALATRQDNAKKNVKINFFIVLCF